MAILTMWRLPMPWPSQPSAPLHGAHRNREFTISYAGHQRRHHRGSRRRLYLPVKCIRRAWVFGVLSIIRLRSTAPRASARWVSPLRSSLSVGMIACVNIGISLRTSPSGLYWATLVARLRFSTRVAPRSRKTRRYCGLCAMSGEEELKNYLI